MAKERIRVAIVGAGWAGGEHARYYRKIPFVDLVGWADIVPGKAAAAAAEAGVPASGVFERSTVILERSEGSSPEWQDPSLRSG